MKFKGEPNLFVRISNKYVQRVTGKKGFYFDDNGEYETENEILIKVLSQSFKIIEDLTEEIEIAENCIEGIEIIEEKPLLEDKKPHKCKKCGESFENKGLLMAHYREHKKEESE